MDFFHKTNNKTRWWSTHSVFIILTVICTWYLFYKKLDINSLNINHSLTLYDMNNHAFARYLYENDSGILKVVKQISFKDVKEIKDSPLDELLTATEDRAFYEKNPDLYFRGVNLRGIGRAIYSFGRLGGGSSIPMQLTKFLREDATLSFNRKLTDIIGAINSYTTFDKDALLNFYCNYVPINQVYGFKAASLAYLGKDLSKLNLSELALLVSSVKGGIYCNFNKFNDTQIAEKVKARRNRILVTANLLHKNQIKLNPSDTNKNLPNRCCFGSKLLADPYINFSEYIISIELNKYQFNDSIKKLKDLNVYTTLDTSMQSIVQSSISESVSKFGKDIHAAMVVMNEKHQIIALADENPGTEYRQNFNYSRFSFMGGSTIKPFAYALYMEKHKKNRRSLLFDGDFKTCKNTPQNFGHRVSNQKQTLSWCLKESSNKAIYNLMCQKYISPSELANKLHKAGISSYLDTSNYYMPLGTDNYFIMELVNAYKVFNQEGYWYPSYAIRKITESTNSTALEIYKPPEGEQVFPKWVCNEILFCLHEVTLNGTAKAIPKEIKLSSFGKTGTTNNSKDAWFIGSYKGKMAGIWVGVDKTDLELNSLPLSIATGSKACVPIWSKVMCKYHKVNCN